MALDKPLPSVEYPSFMDLYVHQMTFRNGTFATLRQTRSILLLRGESKILPDAQRANENGLKRRRLSKGFEGTRPHRLPSIPEDLLQIAKEIHHSRHEIVMGLMPP